MRGISVERYKPKSCPDVRAPVIQILDDNCMNSCCSSAKRVDEIRQSYVRESLGRNRWARLQGEQDTEVYHTAGKKTSKSWDSSQNAREGSRKWSAARGRLAGYGTLYRKQ